MNENKNMTCDPCERDFEQKVNELVKEGKAPSHMARIKREHEVKAAFGAHHPAAAEKKQPEKQPAMASHAKCADKAKR